MRIMNIFRNPRICLWIGRILPAAVWMLWLVAILVPNFGPDYSLGMSLLFLVCMLSVAAYILWVYIILPELLFGDNYRGFFLRVGYFLFTGVTAGLGPVVWYFFRVDSILHKMAAAQKGKSK